MSINGFSEKHTSTESIKEYRLSELLEKREKRRFSLEETQKLVKVFGYKTFWLDTGIPRFNPANIEDCKIYHEYFNVSSKGNNPWSKMHWAGGQKRVCMERMKLGHVPSHFAYIKFYTADGQEGSYALVSGKTNLANPDFCFDLFKDEKSYKEKKIRIRKSRTPPADLSKVWLYEHQCHWDPRKLLIFWNPKIANIEDESSLAASAAECNIGGLLGLFSS